MKTPLDPSLLLRRCDPASLPVQTTDELEDLPGGIGQERAEEAAVFGLGIRSPGYNVFVLGPTGSGKRRLVLQLLDERKSKEPTPADQVYIHNFAHPHKSQALLLPPGWGSRLREDMRRLLDELRQGIPAAFESDEYRTRAAQIEEEFTEKQNHTLEEIGREAANEKIALLRTPGGFSLAPLSPEKPGEVLSPDEYMKLPAADRERMEGVVQRLQGRLETAIHQFHVWRREQFEKLRALNEEAVQFAVGHSMADLRRTYTDLPQVLQYFEHVQKDAIENMQDFRRGGETGITIPGMGSGPPDFTRYSVNLLVDHGSNGGAPVIYEESPSYQNLIGRVEHLAQFGALVTNFTLIKGGALHRANGGYLILDAQKLLTQPFAWEGLKRAISTGEIRIESPGQMYSLVSTVSLEPEPISFNAKVVLVGDRYLYYLLSLYDPEFKELFKIQADIEDEVKWSPENGLLLARFVASLVRREKLLPFDRTALARFIECAARMADDRERLITHIESLSNLAREAHHHASLAGRGVVQATDIDRALDAKEKRTGRIRERSREQIQRGTLQIATTGAVTGQINGLSVLSTGDSVFALPTRITASVRPGEGQVLDIQREVKLGGPIHSKGVLILSSFLGRHFGQSGSLSLTASLVFEQTYGAVDGDSASVAELCTILSALADLPIRQDLAVTGSVDQLGTVQAIGGVNEKIEGFFAICKERGLTGTQGVIIPATNIPHLMLREEVVQAAAQGSFHVHAAEKIEDVIELLMGLPAGQPEQAAASEAAPTPPQYAEGTVYRRVQDTLRLFNERRRAASGPPKGDGQPTTEKEPENNGSEEAKK